MKGGLYASKRIYIPRAMGVKEYAFYDDMNYPNRPYMEDAFFIVDNFLQDGGKSILFGVLDGHGGSGVVDYVKVNFAKSFAEEYMKTPKDLKEALKRAFIKVDDMMREKVDSEKMGSTACIGIIRFEDAKRVLYMANVGDTNCVVLDDVQATTLNVEHKTSNPRELERIKKVGGSVMYDRVGGVLAVSRSFGDHSLRGFGVIATPDVISVDLRIIHKYLIVATDGLWDVITPKDTLEVSKLKSNCEEIAAELLKRALANRSRDNISILVLKLN